MKTFQKTSSHIETYILECDFPHESSFLKQIEAKREFSLSLLPNTKPIYQFSEKAHTFDEYISIADSLFLKKIQTTIPPHFVTKYQQYTIQNTETIYGIALKFDVNPEILNNLNFLTEDSILFPGQVISIPTKELYQKPNSSEELAPHIEELSLLDVKDWINFEEENNEETKEEIDNNLPIEEMILLRRSSDINVDLLSFKANPTGFFAYFFLHTIIY